MQRVGSVGVTAILRRSTVQVARRDLPPVSTLDKEALEEVAKVVDVAVELTFAVARLLLVTWRREVSPIEGEDGAVGGADTNDSIVGVDASLDNEVITGIAGAVQTAPCEGDARIRIFERNDECLKPFVRVQLVCPAYRRSSTGYRARSARRPVRCRAQFGGRVGWVYVLPKENRECAERRTRWANRSLATGRGSR